jgi:hypothetical protein
MIFKYPAGLALLFFSSLFLTSLVAAEVELPDDAAKARWQALLHMQGSRLQIQDPGFLLSLPDFSPQRELQATLALLRADQQSICRFPARYQFLVNLGYALPEFPPCPEYRTFLNRVAVDNVSVIYASENLTQPTSMMGHAMLAVSGTLPDGREVDHAVTFLTEIDTYNPLTLFYDTILAGKEGYFLVQPMSAYYRFYLIQEQRPVWRYRIRMDEQSRMLLQAHIWELKQAHILYLFDTHNCATMALDLLALAYPDINQDPGWVSPLDVARLITGRDIVEDTRVTLSARWGTRMLSEETGDEGVKEAEMILASGSLEAVQDQGEKGYLVRQLARYFNNYRYQTGEITETEWNRAGVTLDAVDDSQYALDVSDYRSPMDAPLDAQFNLGWQQIQNRHWATLSWMPASHQITDDNRQNFTENELVFFEPTIKVSEAGEVRLHQWQVLSVQGFVPYDHLTGGISGRLAVGLNPVIDQQLHDHLSLQIAGAGGYTIDASADLRLYALAGMGVAMGQDQRYAYLEPEVGAYLYEVWGMKSRLSWRPRLRQDQDLMQHYHFSQSLALDNHALVFEADHWQVNQVHRTDVQLQWRWYY